jgi:hypothetical protein
MSKRSREASFSPPAGLRSSSVSDTHSSELTSSADIDLERPTKFINSEETRPSRSIIMQCSLPPHRQPVDFPSIEAFEVHYSKDHSRRCSSCGKNFPSPHFLALHIDENHNPMRAELQAKGEKTYGCFLEDCERKCSTPQKRRLHLIDKHAFPKFYNFRVIDEGIEGRQTMLKEPRSHRRRVSTANELADVGVRRRRASSQLVNDDSHTSHTATTAAIDGGHTKHRHPPGTSNNEVEELEHSMSALRFVPPSVMRQQMKKPWK